MIAHNYFDISDDRAAYEADECNRVRTTVAWAYDNVCDVTVWTLDADANEAGLDGWRQVEIDKHVRGEKYDLHFGQSGMKTVDADHPVFIQRKDLPIGTNVPLGIKLQALSMRHPSSRGGFEKYGCLRLGDIPEEPKPSEGKSIQDKSVSADSALRRLLAEMTAPAATHGNKAVIEAVEDFLANADDDTKAKLYDVVRNS